MEMYFIVKTQAFTFQDYVKLETNLLEIRMCFKGFEICIVSNGIWNYSNVWKIIWNLIWCIRMKFHIKLIEHWQYAPLMLSLHSVVRPSDAKTLSLENVQVRFTWAKSSYICPLLCSWNRTDELDMLILVNSLRNKE